jgi:hypothetical protein
LRIGLDAAGDLEAVDSRHAVVDDDRVGEELLREAQPLLARVGGDGVISATLQKPARDLQVVRVVVDDDDPMPFVHGPSSSAAII